MYKYHGSDENERRVGLGICRCASEGDVYSLADYLEDGRIFDPREPGILLSTPRVRKARSDPSPPGSGYGRTFIFAVNSTHTMHVAPDCDRGHTTAVKHETLFHNADVLAAGEIAIIDGVIVGVNDISGSYVTDGELESNPTFAKSLLEAIEKLQLPIEPSLKDELQNLRQV